MIFCNGFPKHGNHALVKAVQLLGQPCEVRHVPYTTWGPQEGIFIKRDPRNALVSWLRWNKQPVTPGMFLTAFRKFQDKPLVEEMRPYEGWLTHLAADIGSGWRSSGMLVVRYEDLIASDAEMRRIAAYLRVPYLDGAWEQLPGITQTWNDVHSDYREVWTTEVREAWAAEGGKSLLVRWGY